MKIEPPLGHVQKAVMRLLKEHSPVTMSTIRARLYPDDWKTGNIRVKISKAISALEARHLVTRRRTPTGTVQVSLN